MIDVLARIEARGMESGIAIGEERERLAVARRMKAGGLSVEHISKFIGLSVEAIESLKKTK